MNGNGQNHEERLNRLEKLMESVTASQMTLTEGLRELAISQKTLAESQQSQTGVQRMLTEGLLDLTSSQKTLTVNQQALVESNHELNKGLQQLLKAQVLLTDQLEKTIRTVDRLGVRVDRVDGQMEGLIKIVDGMIRDRGV
jgi:chromosome segregation ATPase